MASNVRRSTAKRRRNDADIARSDWSDDKRSSDSDSNSDTNSSSDESDSQSARGVAPRKRVTTPAQGQPVWTRQDCLPDRFEFSGNSGVAAVDLDDSSTPLDVFIKFLPDELLDHIADQTNKYAEDNLNCVDLDSHSRIWFETTPDELKALLSLVTLMGVTTKPDARAYWSREPMMETPFFANTMPRDRFFQLVKNLHFNNDADDDGTDRLFKLRPVIDTMTENFKTVYVPSQNISTDESLWKFDGRPDDVEPSKRARFVIKVYKTCQSTGDAAGYTWNMKIYTEQNRGTLPASTRTVLDLNEDLLDRGYNIFLNNWFSSPDLFLRLRDRQTNACGTVGLHRKHMPWDLKTVKLKRGECVFRSSDSGLLALVWKDKKEVKMLSTMHSTSMEETGRNDKTGRPMRKPACVLDYIRGKCGVEISDQLASSHQIVGKTIKWYKKLFFYMVDLCLINAFIVYKLIVEDISYIDFRMALIEEILHGVTLPEYTTRVRSHTLPSPARLTGRHFPVTLPPTAKVTNPCRRCVVCKAEGRRRETRYACDICNAPLCVHPCFKTYHTERDY